MRISKGSILAVYSVRQPCPSVSGPKTEMVGWVLSIRDWSCQIYSMLACIDSPFPVGDLEIKTTKVNSDHRALRLFSPLIGSPTVHIF